MKVDNKDTWLMLLLDLSKYFDVVHNVSVVNAQTTRN